MPTLDKLIAQRDALLAIAGKHGAHSVRIFGSVARGEDTERSDIDFLIALDSGRSLLDLIGLKNDLEDYLHRPTDVVTEGCLHHLIRQRVLDEAKPL